MIAFRVRALEETTSTNDEVKRAIEAGEPEGLAVRALRQTGGYGRQGRTWKSPDGGLYMSLLLRPRVPMTQLSTLSLACGVAVRRALCSLAPADVASDIQIKWPNDVLCSAGKLCGISLETHAGAVCVGIGVNVFAPREALQVGGKNRPAYVADRAPEVTLDAAAEAILREFAPVYDAWCASGLAPFVGEINENERLTGTFVQMVDISGKTLAEGVAVRVDERGCLVLRDADGCERPVASGEAHVAARGLSS